MERGGESERERGRKGERFYSNIELYVELQKSLTN